MTCRGYGCRVARRGRPKGGDSVETRRRIIGAARREFARSGYDGASIAAIATNSELAPSAVYHYFGGKQTLYEDVFNDSVESIWTDIDSAATKLLTLRESIESIVYEIDKLDEFQRDCSNFLALVPMETKLHPEFAPLIKRRAQHQNNTFRAMAELGIATGELDGFDIVGATEMLRALIMGWFLESHFRGHVVEGSGEALVRLIEILGDRRS